MLMLILLYLKLFAGLTFTGLPTRSTTTFAYTFTTGLMLFMVKACAMTFVTVRVKNYMGAMRNRTRRRTNHRGWNLLDIYLLVTRRGLEAWGWLIVNLLLVLRWWYESWRLLVYWLLVKGLLVRLLLGIYWLLLAVNWLLLAISRLVLGLRRLLLGILLLLVGRSVTWRVIHLLF